MLEQDITWLTPLALVRHFLPLLPDANGSLPSHWAMARALCSVAEDVVLLARPSTVGGLLPASKLADVAAGTDELGRMLLVHLPFRNEAARRAWPQVQAYLLQVIPAIERLLVAGTPFPGVV